MLKEIAFKNIVVPFTKKRNLKLVNNLSKIVWKASSIISIKSTQKRNQSHEKQQICINC